ncbi:glutathione S-transferase family protein [Mesorhizobium sp. M0644]|uniref:glutathione S-transferase family protein n=1 Tax=unclassified Mesorhizobium TaxID=325217 RepID=UPI0033355207
MAEFTLFIGNKCFSSWSLRPWLAMKHLEIPFEEGLVRLRTPETAANLARISPTGQVPVLNHRLPNGEVRIVWETLAILEYLAELFPGKKLWPADIGARALARSAATEMHSGFREVRYGWPMNLRRPKGHKGEAQRARIEDLWRECRGKYGKGGPFLFGRFTVADAMYAPVVTRFDTYGGTLAPDTRAYVDAVLSMPAMRHWYAEAAKEPWPEPGPDE